MSQIECEAPFLYRASTGCAETYAEALSPLYSNICVAFQAVTLSSLLVSAFSLVRLYKAYDLRFRLFVLETQVHLHLLTFGILLTSALSAVDPLGYATYYSFHTLAFIDSVKYTFLFNTTITVGFMFLTISSKKYRLKTNIGAMNVKRRRALECSVVVCYVLRFLLFIGNVISYWQYEVWGRLAGMLYVTTSLVLIVYFGLLLRKGLRKPSSPTSVKRVICKLNGIITLSIVLAIASNLGNLRVVLEFISNKYSRSAGEVKPPLPREAGPLLRELMNYTMIIVVAIAVLTFFNSTAGTKAGRNTNTSARSRGNSSANKAHITKKPLPSSPQAK